MEPRKVFWKKKYIIKNSPQWEISGYSRSSFRTGFYIKGLNIMLDAGPQCFKNPEHIFVTHSHADHIANLPLTLIDDEDSTNKYNIYIPKKAIQKIKKYISSMFEANALCDHVPIDEWFHFHEIEDIQKAEPIHITTNKNNLIIEIIKCKHTIPTVSYGFGLKKNKLNPKYVDFDKKELGNLRKQGVSITVETIEKIFCYICDTNIDVIEEHPFIFDYKTIFIECTFIMDGEEEIASKKNHIHWNHLKPHVLQHPEITFMLFHFSLKYKDEEIKEYLENEFKNHHITNVELWLSDLCD